MKYVRCLCNIWCDFRCKACHASSACGTFGVITGERLAMRQVLVAIFGVISGVRLAMHQVLVEYLV